MPRHQYSHIKEVRNVGRRRANRLLANGWILLGWELGSSVDSRDGIPDPNTEERARIYFHTRQIEFILGRPDGADYTSAVMDADEQREAREKREKRRAAEPEEGKELASGPIPDLREGETATVRLDRTGEEARAPDPDAPGRAFDRIPVLVLAGFATEPLALYETILAIVADHRAELLDVDLVMGAGVWEELSDLWPRAYYVGGTKSGLDLEDPELIRAFGKLRDEMRAESYLLIDMTRVAVVIATDVVAIDEEARA